MSGCGSVKAFSILLIRPNGEKGQHTRGTWDVYSVCSRWMVVTMMMMPYGHTQ